MDAHGALRDDSETARLREELAQAREALEDLRHTVSHDLRAPLRHVRSFIRIAQEDLGNAAPPDVASHLRTAAEAADQLGRMFDALLELSTLGRHVMEPACLSLGPLVDEACRLAEAAAPVRAAEGASSPPPVAWSIAPDFPSVQADPVLVTQILQRLLDNALKFTRHAPQPTIEVGWRLLGDGWCEIHVRDNGVGFEQRFAGRLFQVFQRLHSPRDFEGLGSGLAYVRQAVERHGGHVRADGERRPGCEVAFSLPLADGVGA